MYVVVCFSPRGHRAPRICAMAPRARGESGTPPMGSGARARNMPQAPATRGGVGGGGGLTLGGVGVDVVAVVVPDFKHWVGVKSYPVVISTPVILNGGYIYTIRKVYTYKYIDTKSGCD